jgi:hypothetical protein
MKDVRERLFYTSWWPEATQASLGNDIYVIEVRAENQERAVLLAGQGTGPTRNTRRRPWRPFRSRMPVADGAARRALPFRLAEIVDVDANAWLREKTPTMAEMPSTWSLPWRP